jgi:TonB family protein
MRTYDRALLEAVLLASFVGAPMPIAARTQEKPATTPTEPRLGVLKITGMVGFVSSVGSSQMELTLLEHAILTVRILSSTQVTEDGQPASLSSIRVASAVRVHGAFDLEEHTVEAAAIDVLPPKESRLLERRSGNFLKTWTIGTVTDVQPDSVVLQRLDGELQTIQLGTDTFYVHRGEPVSFAWLRKGERIMVDFPPNHPALARIIRIQGMISQTLNAQEPPKPQVEPEQLSQPSCLFCPNPDFPDEARKANIISAKAMLEITVSEKGKVDPHDIRVIDDPGDGFTKGAVSIVKKWKFKPATDKDGKPVTTTTRVEIRWWRSN